MDSTRVRVAVGAAAIVVAAVASAILFTGETEKPAAKPESIGLPAPPPRPAPLRPEPPPPIVTALHNPMPAAAAPAVDARSSAGEITTLLVTARRVENTDPARSRKLLREVLDADPRNSEALESLSRKLITDEKAKDAAELVDRCLQAEPENKQCAALKAKISTEAPSTAAVLKAKECLSQNPNSVDCMYTMAESELHEDRKYSAGLYAMGLHHVAPESASTKYMLGRLKAASGEYAVALPLFAGACELGNTDACFRADLLRSEGW